MRLTLFIGAVMLFGVTTQAQPAGTDTRTSAEFEQVRTAEGNELKPHIGLQLGYAEPGDDHDAAAQYGIEVGYQPYIPFGLALEVSSFETDRDNQENLRRTTAIAKATYNFGGTAPLVRYSFVGAGMGAAMDSKGEDETNVGFKWLAGFDIPLNRSGVTTRQTFTLGATASYLSVLNAQDTFALNGQVKYWF